MARRGPEEGSAKGQNPEQKSLFVWAILANELGTVKQNGALGDLIFPSLFSYSSLKQETHIRECTSGHFLYNIKKGVYIHTHIYFNTDISLCVYIYIYTHTYIYRSIPVGLHLY